MLTVKTLLITFAALAVVNAQRVSLGACQVQPEYVFNITAYAGRWYEQARTTFLFEAFGKCVTADYTLLSDGSVKVVNTMISTLTGHESSVTGTATTDPNHPSNGKLQVKFDYSPSAPYWVFDTDYSSYAIVYSCGSLGDLVKSEVFWILTRDRTVSDDLLDSVKALATRHGLNEGWLSRTNQVDCVDKVQNNPETSQVGEE